MQERVQSHITASRAMPQPPELAMWQWAHGHVRRSRCDSGSGTASKRRKKRMRRSCGGTFVKI
jgi:hypothetical protein